MNLYTPLTLVNKQNGNLAFKYLPFQDGRYFDHLQRNNYYSFIWIQAGSGDIMADLAEYRVDKDSIFTFSPYQPYMISSEDLKGLALHFHPDFFCIHKHQREVACNGILFNNLYQPPVTRVDIPSITTLQGLFEQIRKEMETPSLAQFEILVSYLKIVLITASRLKAAQNPELISAPGDTHESFILQHLKEAIERDFKKKHTPAEYAEELNISAKALARLTRNYFNRTLTELISERIIIEAKRELYLTRKTIKEIAYELGYADEYYFSRFFKSNTEVSPQLYRETVGFGRGEN